MDILIKLIEDNPWFGVVTAAIADFAIDKLHQPGRQRMRPMCICPTYAVVEAACWLCAARQRGNPIVAALLGNPLVAALLGNPPVAALLGNPPAAAHWSSDYL